MIAQADSSAASSSAAAASVKSEKKSSSHKKKSTATPSRTPLSSTSSLAQVGAIDTTGIKFPDARAAGVSLRSQRMKLPQTVGQKRSKAIEQMLGEVGMETAPMPTEEVCGEFNDLRSDMFLLYELKNALSACEVELQSLKVRRLVWTLDHFIHLSWLSLRVPTVITY